MTQNKILDAKIESNANQYKVDRLNAEISAFSSGDLNRYEFLKRIDLNYKPNALDKARFEFSPLGQTFNTGLDKNAQGYQEEGIIKLLKDIRDGLAGGITPRAPRVPRAPKVPRGSDDDDDDDDIPDLETEEQVAKANILNKFSNKINNFDEMVKNKLNNDAKKLNKLNSDVKKLRNYVEENNDKIINKEKELDTVKNERDILLLKLNQSNEELNRTKNELFEIKEKLNDAGDNINEKTNYTDKLKEIQENHDYQNNKVKELESELNEKNKHIVGLKNNIKNLENKNRNTIAKSNKNFEIINKAHDQEIEKLKQESKTNDDKVFDALNKFKNNIESKMSDLDEMVTSKENKLNSKLNKLNNNVKKLDNYIKENNNEKINKEIELDAANNEYNRLLLKLNQSNEELNRTRNELFKTKDIDKKLKKSMIINIIK